MKNYIVLTLIISALFSQTSSAQSNLPDFGSFSSQEINMTECSFDKDADAVILLDEAHSYYDDDYELVTDRRIRVKILTQKGIDRGNIKIPFFSKDNYETIGKVSALTYNSTDNTTTSTVSKKSVYTVKDDDKYSSVRFALPNVKPGSIIEYKYQSTMKDYGGLDRWLFQSDMPTLRSCYLLAIIPNAQFSYFVNKKKNYPITITPMPEEGQVYFEMDNIPGLRFEPYMDAPKDYLQNVEFQFAAYKSRTGDLVEVNKSWSDISFSLATDDGLGGVLKKSLSVPVDLKMQADTVSNLKEKAFLIYNYVRRNFTWNGYNSKYAPDGLKAVTEKRTGTAGELNLVLINYLQSFGIDATPLLVAERDFGKVDPKYPLIDRFNKTVALVTINNEAMVFDVSQKFCPPGLTPYPLLNTYALPIQKKNQNLLQIVSNNDSYKNTIDIKGSVAEDGVFSGDAVITSRYYAKEIDAEKISENKQNYTVNEFENVYDGLKIDSFSYKYSDDPSLPLVQNIQFHNAANNNGGYLLLNCNLFTGLYKNPFIKQERFTNINFGYPYDIRMKETIKLPDNAKTDDLPKDAIFETSRKDISLTRQVRRNGNILTIDVSFKQTITLVSSESYDALRDYYKGMVNILNEPVIIKF